VNAAGQKGIDLWLQGTGMGYDLLSAGRLPEYEAF